MNCYFCHRRTLPIFSVQVKKRQNLIDLPSHCALNGSKSTGNYSRQDIACLHSTAAASIICNTQISMTTEPELLTPFKNLKIDFHFVQQLSCQRNHN